MNKNEIGAMIFFSWIGIFIVSVMTVRVLTTIKFVKNEEGFLYFLSLFWPIALVVSVLYHVGRVFFVLFPDLVARVVIARGIRRASHDRQPDLGPHRTPPIRCDKCGK